MVWKLVRSESSFPIALSGLLFDLVICSLTSFFECREQYWQKRTALARYTAATQRPHIIESNGDALDMHELEAWDGTSDPHDTAIAVVSPNEEWPVA